MKWTYDPETGLYFQTDSYGNQMGIGLTFDELARELDYVGGYDER